MNPDLPMGHGSLALTLAKLGRRAEAAEAGRKSAALYGAGTGDVLAALAVAGAGLADEARLRLSECEQFRKQKNVWLVGLAMAYAAIGELDFAIARLEEAYEARDFWMVWLKVQPELNPLRGDARFHELLRKVHLDEAGK